MPRIDPLELLDCLEVLLTSTGGIKSEQEVSRVSSLMERFSKKLVSKSVYLLILKATETNLLSMFMEYGGWHLVHSWLVHGLEDKNWPLLTQILDVLVICPIDIDRLKSNALPRHVKYLSKASIIPQEIRDLATIIVRNWLVVVKAATQAEAECQKFDPSVEVEPSELKSAELKESSSVGKASDSSNVEVVTVNGIESETKKSKNKPASFSINQQKKLQQNKVVDIEKPTTSPNKGKKLKIVESKSEAVDTKPLNKRLRSCTVAKSHAVISDESDGNDSDYTPVEQLPKKLDGKRKTKMVKEEPNIKKQQLSKKANKCKPEEINVNENKEAVFAKPVGSFKLNLVKQEGGAYSSKLSLSSTKRKLSDVQESIKKLREESEVTKSVKNQLKNLTSESQENVKINKNLERIPKKPETFSKRPMTDKTDLFSKSDTISIVKSKTDDDKTKMQKKHPEVSKKPSSISVETRNSNEARPKTVKTFHSKFRLTGLEEPISTVPPKVTTRKVPAIVERKKVKDDVFEPPEKKPRSPMLNDISEKKLKSPLLDSNEEDNDKPSYAKFLTSPKSVANHIQESGGFIDAMVSAAHTHKEHQRKRKKLSKDDSLEDNKEQPETDQYIHTKPKLRFYKDTMESDNSDDNSDEKGSEKQTENSDLNKSSNEIEGDKQVKLNKGILKPFHVGPYKTNLKKSVRWKTDTELEAVQTFEVDVSERTNVSKNFWDMQMLERSNERAALFKSRKSGPEDYNSSWLPLIPIDFDTPVVLPGCNSTEREAQILRSRSIPEAIYFEKDMIPDSPSEPDLEIFAATIPPVIPLDDVTGSVDSINDFSECKWPEPKVNASGSTETSSSLANTLTMNTVLNSHSLSSQNMYSQFPNVGNFPQNPNMPPNPYSSNSSIPGNWNNNSMQQGAQVGSTMPQPMIPMCPPPVVPSDMGQFVMPPMSAPTAPIHYSSQNSFNTNMYLNIPPQINMPIDPAIQNWIPSNNSKSTNMHSDWISRQNVPAPANEWKKNNESFGTGGQSDNKFSNHSWNSLESTHKQDPSFKNISDRGVYGGYSDNRRDSWKSFPSDRGFEKRGGSWRGNVPPRGSGGSTRGSGGPSANSGFGVRLCRNFKQHGRCTQNGCKFFHPRN